MDIRYGRKRSGIKRELIKKIEAWLATIDNVDVQMQAKEDVIVTGGSIASMLLGEPINDFDVYFRTKETAKAVAGYYVGKYNAAHQVAVGEDVTPYQPEVREESIENIKGDLEDRIVIFLKSAGVVGEDQEEYNYFESLSAEQTAEFAESLVSSESDKKEPFRPVFMSQNAITLSDKLQIITRFYGEPDEIHNNYDFVHATCYWDHAKKVLHLPSEALEALLSRTLVYRGSLYPIASIFRMKKFLERGWRITAGQQLKIMWQISEIDLTDYSVLREQLTGVDMAYMYELIDALKGVDAGKIDSAYVSTIIDRIFD